MTITSKKVYTGGGWKDITAGWVYQSGWKRIIRYSTYSSTGTPTGWKSSPLEIPAAPIIQSAQNPPLSGIRLDTLKYDASGGPVSSGGTGSNFLRAGEYIVYGSTYLIMQADGNLVGFNNATNIPNSKIWESKTASPTGQSSTYYLEVESDGNFYIKNSSGAKVAATSPWITGGAVWGTGGLRSYLGLGTTSMALGRLTIQPDMHIVWYPTQTGTTSGLGIGTYYPVGGNGIVGGGPAHPCLPFYPSGANPPDVVGSQYRLYEYRSNQQIKGAQFGTAVTGNWGSTIRATSTLDPNTPFITYEVATVAANGLESADRATFRWKIGTAGVPAVARVEGWGASTYRWAENNFTASLGPGTQLCIVPSGTFSATVDSILNFNTAGYNYSGVFRPYQEGDTGLQPRNNYGLARWIGGTQWSGYGAGAMAAPSVNIHAKTRRRVTNLELHYNQGFDNVVSQSGYTTDYADGFTIYQLWTPGVTVGGETSSNDGVVRWDGLNIDTASASAIGFQCIRGAFFIGGNLTTSPGYGLNARCEIYGIIETSEPWEVKVAGSAGIAATTGSQWQ